MKIFFFIYRAWAFNIVKSIINKNDYNDLEIFTNHNNVLSSFDIKKYKIRISKNNFPTIKFLRKEKPNIIFSLGWSNLIDHLIYKKFLCICLHPSMLPNFRGGSPLQNQIIRNQLISGLTLFKMNKFIDGGPIIRQCNLNLKGGISLVQKRIEIKGLYLINNFLKDYKNKKKLIFKKQNLKNKKIYKRRKLNESFFLINDLKNKSFIFFNNLVNMLNDPYPNAYTVIGNKKIYIQKISKTNQNLKYLKDIRINRMNKNVNNYLIKLKDCNVKVIKSSIF